MKFLKDSIEVYFYNIGEDEHFLNRTQNVLTTKEKTDKLINWTLKLGISIIKR